GREAVSTSISRRDSERVANASGSDFVFELAEPKHRGGARISSTRFRARAAAEADRSGGAASGRRAERSRGHRRRDTRTGTDERRRQFEERVLFQKDPICDQPGRVAGSLEALAE